MADSGTGGLRMFSWVFRFLMIILAGFLIFSAYRWTTRGRPSKIDQYYAFHQNPGYNRGKIPKRLHQNRGKIPKRLHQTYVRRRVPTAYTPYIKSWVSNHPDWEYWFWSNDDGRAFIRDKYPKYLKMYDKYSDDLQRSDAVRYFILHHYGGVYADMDMESYKPIDSLVKNYTCFFSEEPPIESILVYNVSSIPMNALMGSTQHHDFFEYLLHYLPQQQRPSSTKNEATYITGPLMLQRAITNYNKSKSKVNDTASIIPYKFLMPNIDPGQTDRVRNQYCKRKHLSSLEQKACLDYKDYAKLSPKERLKDAYADHKFLHLGYRMKIKDIKTVDVYSLVPTVHRYKSSGS